MAGWSEAHLTLASCDTASVVIWAALHPESGSAEQLALVWPHAGKPIVMVEAGISMPGNRWEFRTDGLWAEQVCETPDEHWSYGLEAFALELDDATELIRTGYGTRVPLGWELEFEAQGKSHWLLTDPAPVEQAGAYTQPGHLHGILLGPWGETPADGPAQRWHWWGGKPLTAAGIGSPAGGPEKIEVPMTDGVYSIRRTTGSISVSRELALT